MKSTLLLKLGKQIKYYRLKMNLSQEELANRANVHRTYIGMVERGEKNITISSLKKIATALEIDISLLTRDL